MRPKRVHAVAGAKGGVGKTTTAINLGAALAGAGLSTAVVELDLAMANLVDFLDLPRDLDGGSAPTLHDVLAGRATVKEATYEAPGGASVIPSGTVLDGFRAAHVDRLDDVLDALGAYEVAILDTGAGLSRETLVPLALADETVLVSTPRVASVRDTRKTKALAERVGGRVAGAVFVRSGTGKSPPVERIAGFLDVDLLGHVPEDPAVPASQDAGQPVVTDAPDSPAGRAYRDIARRLASRGAGRVPGRDTSAAAERARLEVKRHREDGFRFVDDRQT